MILYEVVGLDNNNLPILPYHILISYFEFCRAVKKGLEMLEEAKAKKGVKRIMMDSGAFTFLGHKVQMSEDELFDYLLRYGMFIRAAGDLVDDFIELDVDSVVGVKKTREWRLKLAEMTGRVPMVVHHRIRGAEELYRYESDGFDYVGVPMVFNRKLNGRESALRYAFAIKKEVKKLHLLGVADTKTIVAVKPYSADAAGVVVPSRWRGVPEVRGGWQKRLMSNAELMMRGHRTDTHYVVEKTRRLQRWFYENVKEES